MVCQRQTKPEWQCKWLSHLHCHSGLVCLWHTIHHHWPFGLRKDCPMTHGPLYEYWPKDGADGEGHFYRECSAKGFCNHKTGECDCLPGYEGSACQRNTCPDDCNGHGTCESITDLATAYGTTYDLWDASKSFACKCDPGFTGPSCADRLCPYGADPLTNADYEDANNINKNSNDIRNAHVATLHIDLR